MVDLNCDVGEGYPDDDALLAVVTSANVACGFHAGDAETMRRTCAMSAERGVTVGAQVSYRDREGFGRRHLAVAPGILRDDVAEQIATLMTIAADVGAAVRYVKPHGALYHACSTDPAHGDAVVEAMHAVAEAYDGPLRLLVQAGSPFAHSAAAAGLSVVTEAFADRGYRDDGTLVPRDEPGAVHGRPEDAAQQAVSIALDHAVTAVSGARVAIDALSICMHGDTPGALDIAHAVRAALEERGVGVAPFA